MQKKGRKVNYLNDLLKAYKVMFRYAYDEGYIKTILTEKIHNAKGAKVLIRAFSEDELKRIARHFEGQDFLSVRNRLIVYLLIDTGIRLSEMLELTDEQVKSDYLLIRGKGNKERVVPKSPLLNKWLLKYAAVRQSYFTYRNVPDNILLSRNGKPLNTAMVDRILKDAGRACNVSKDVRVSAHTFRHTYAQYQLKHGLDIYTLARLLGHENISITQRYLDGIRDTDVLKQGQKTSPLMNL
jgi:integrase/recombinase XerD